MRVTGIGGDPEGIAAVAFPKNILSEINIHINNRPLSGRLLHHMKPGGNFNPHMRRSHAACSGAVFYIQNDGHFGGCIVSGSADGIEKMERLMRWIQTDMIEMIDAPHHSGSGKTFQHRYQLADFGRGFMRLALQTGTPIVPVGVVGGEESIISIYNWKGMARLLGMPYVPISPLIPLLGPLAYAPMPVRFHVRFGEPLHFTGPFDDEDSEIDKKVKQVTDQVNALVAQGRAERKGVFA